MKFLRKMALLAILVAVGSACATTTTGNSDVPEVRPRELAARVAKADAGWERKTLQPASSLYALKCGKCHKFYDPAAYDDHQWQDWVSKMSRKSKLTAEQEQLLSRYLQTARK
jgi:hypothetical protein